MNKRYKYNLSVIWSVCRRSDSPSTDFEEEETEIIDFPRWLKIKKSDIDSDGTFYNVDKLKKLNVDNDWGTKNVISARLIRKLTIKEELSDDDTSSE